ncbi:MAG: hypothetical protein HC851_18385 [Acaryochloris sp. RU_4_1]|nr:hypothetical protein [Acaryochloris sp. RU_4_1]
MKSNINDLTLEQQKALRLYAQEKGKTWKQNLADDWLRAAYRWGHPDKSYLLQQIRNQYGPSWLADLAMPKQ